jgi:hypothetical protein
MPQFDLNIVESEVITLITLIHETDNKSEWMIVTLQQVSEWLLLYNKWVNDCYFTTSEWMIVTLQQVSEW